MSDRQVYVKRRPYNSWDCVLNGSGSPHCACHCAVRSNTLSMSGVSDLLWCWGFICQRCFRGTPSCKAYPGPVQSGDLCSVGELFNLRWKTCFLSIYVNLRNFRILRCVTHRSGHDWRRKQFGSENSGERGLHLHRIVLEMAWRYGLTWQKSRRGSGGVCASCEQYFRFGAPVSWVWLDLGKPSNQRRVYPTNYPDPGPLLDS